LRIVHDLFPCFVAAVGQGTLDSVHDLASMPATLGAHTMDKARVVVSDDRILIAIDGDTEGPRIVFNQPVIEFYKSESRTKDSYVVTENGSMIAYRKNEACGCGSRLRSWNPYGHIYSKNDPTE
jgi:hypothetical protein